MAKKSHFFTGIFLGTLLGGAYGMLFAQKKGVQFRKELAETYKKKGNIYTLITHDLEAVAKESLEASKELFESKPFQSFVKESKVKLEDLKKLALDKSDIAKEELKKKLDYLSEFAQEKSKEWVDYAQDQKEKLIKTGKKKVGATTKNVKKKIFQFKKKIIR